MARIRTIKPEFWADEDLSELPTEAHMLAAALLNHADDEGYFNANPKLVKAACCPLREDSVSVHECLTMLSNIGYLRIGKGEDGKRYGHIIRFKKHQRINRPSDSKIGTLSITWDESLNNHGAISECSSPEGNREQGREGEQGTGRGSADKPRTDSDYPDYPDAFEAVWQKYPKRAGGNPKRKAYQAWRARVKSGVDPGEIQAGVERYAFFVRTTGKENTEFVKQGATFFGPDEHYLEEWAPPAPESQGKPVRETPQERGERMARERGYL